jgi:GntR family transcriptional regulator, transcriptional repressor for pyruvate dehydrogenase complex
MDKVSLQDLTEARLALEMGALPLILARIKSTNYAELEQNLDEVRENLRQGVRGKRNLAFHVLLLKASGNPLLIKIAEGLFDLMGRLLEQYEYSGQRSRKVMKIHEELIQLMKAKKYERLRKALEAHIKDSIPLVGQSVRGSDNSGRRKTGKSPGRGDH